MVEKMTRSAALAISDSILRAGTHEGRQRLARQFEAEVRAAIEAETCTDPEYCLEVVAETWFQIRRRGGETS
jgi:hypothetical protein